MATRSQLAHLLRRSTFGPRAQELDAAERVGIDVTLTALLAAPAPVSMPTLDTDPLVDLPKGADRTTRQKAQAALRQQVESIQGWWLDRMVGADQQLAERLTY